MPGLLGNPVNHQDPSIPSPILPFSWECLSPSPSPVTSWFSHLPGRPDLLGCLLCSYLARAPFLLSSPQASTDHTDPPPLLSSEAGLLWRHFCTVRMSWMRPPHVPGAHTISVITALGRFLLENPQGRLYPQSQYSTDTWAEPHIFLSLCRALFPSCSLSSCHVAASRCSPKFSGL